MHNQNPRIFSWITVDGMAALNAETPNRARGVAAFTLAISDVELSDLDAQGVRGVRLNTFSRGGMPITMAEIPELVARLKPIGWHIEFLLPGNDLLELMPEPIVDAFVLAWHHDHLFYQSHGKKKQYHRRESDYWLHFSEGLLDDQFDAWKVLVFEKLDSVVKASSLVEMVNSLIRPYLNSSKGHITQETLNLIMFYHNHRRYKGGRRQGKAPIELLTGDTLQSDWVDLLIQHKREAEAHANGASSPVLEIVPGHQGQTAPLEIPPDQALYEPSADADHAWQPTDVEAA